MSLRGRSPKPRSVLITNKPFIRGDCVATAPRRRFVGFRCLRISTTPRNDMPCNKESNCFDSSNEVLRCARRSVSIRSTKRFDLKNELVRSEDRTSLSLLPGWFSSRVTAQCDLPSSRFQAAIQFIQDRLHRAAALTGSHHNALDQSLGGDGIGYGFLKVETESANSR